MNIMAPQRTAPDARGAGKRLTLAALIAVAMLLAFLLGFLPRRTTTLQLDASAAARRLSPPVVIATQTKRAPEAFDVELPGNITPITEAYLYARAAGYLRRRYIDIGDRVRTGQLLAEIDAPDLDQQVTQAEAALSQAEAQYGQAQATQQQLVATRDLAALTWTRYSILQKTGAVSRQDADTQSTAAKTAEANVAAGEKNVRAAANNVHAATATLQRLRTLQGYERVTAPFAGVVTSRNVDVGALISTDGSSQGPTRPLNAPADLPGTGAIFRIAEISRLRVLASVPQTYAPSIAVGQAARVTLPELPNRTFTGKVTHTSSSLDPAARTLLTEVQVANPDGVLLPGMYALVNFTTKRAEPPLLIPDTALVAAGEGTTVAVLRPLTPQEQEYSRAQGADPAKLARFRVVHYRPVRPGRDSGLELEILAGLQDGDEVVTTPNDSVREGAMVQVGGGSK